MWDTVCGLQRDASSRVPDTPSDGSARGGLERDRSNAWPGGPFVIRAFDGLRTNGYAPINLR